MTPGRARASSLILIALIIGLSAIRAYPFLSGVLLTADEITWHLKVIQGTDRLDFWALREAMASGRIGQVFNRPLQYLTAAAHEHLAARIVFIAGWFATLALFARYVERVVGVTTPGLLFIVLVAMLPLEYDHLPPTSFPTLITVPAIGLLLLRFHLHGRYLLSATPPGFGTVLLLLPIMWVLVIFNELQTAFAISLAVFTYAVLAARQCAHMSELKRFFAQHRRIIGFEVMSLAVPITVYSAWRLAFPSGYDGIIVGGTVADALYTLFWHVALGTGLPNLAHTHTIMWFISPIAAAVGALATIAALLLAERNTRFDGPLPTAAATALAMTAIVTLPIALTGKYQRWCATEGYCLYIDGRLAFLWFFAAAFLASGAVLRMSPPRLRSAVVIATCVLIGAYSYISHGRNVVLASQMRETAQAWTRAHALACTTPRAWESLSDVAIEAAIDPDRRVAMHPTFDRIGYWRAYMRYRAADCDPT